MKILIRLVAVLVALALGIWAFLSFGMQPDAFPIGSESAARLQPGPAAVASMRRTFIDDERPTPANGDFPGEDRRRLEGDVWYPDGATGASPLLLFSHGFTSMRNNGAYLAEHLASHGFVVVAVDYPLTSMRAPGGPTVQDVVNQPGDISFLIDTLLADNRDSQHPLGGRIDESRIGVLGISLGGLTSTLAGFHSDWRDPRIGAVLSIAGPTRNFLPRFFQTRPDLPFMMLAGDIDVLVPFASNAAPVPEKLPGAELVSIRGGSHTGFSGGAALIRFMKNTDALGCYSVMRSVDDGDTEAVANVLGGPAEGIDPEYENELCLVDPMPASINVLRQQMIARVVVTAFFEKTLSRDPATRNAASRYLEESLALELTEVSYRRSSAPAPLTVSR